MRASSPRAHLAVPTIMPLFAWQNFSKISLFFQLSPSRHIKYIETENVV
jgi:hypothetical protein